MKTFYAQRLAVILPTETLYLDYCSLCCKRAPADVNGKYPQATGVEECDTYDEAIERGYQCESCGAEFTHLAS